MLKKSADTFFIAKCILSIRIKHTNGFFNDFLQEIYIQNQNITANNKTAHLSLFQEELNKLRKMFLQSNNRRYDQCVQQQDNGAIEPITTISLHES